MSVGGGAGKVTVHSDAAESARGLDYRLGLWRGLRGGRRRARTHDNGHVGCKTSAPYTFDIPGLTGGKT
jgi:hypothetical protein